MFIGRCHQRKRALQSAVAHRRVCCCWKPGCLTRRRSRSSRRLQGPGRVTVAHNKANQRGRHILGTTVVLRSTYLQCNIKTVYHGAYLHKSKVGRSVASLPQCRCVWHVSRSRRQPADCTANDSFRSVDLHRAPDQTSQCQLFKLQRGCLIRKSNYLYLDHCSVAVNVRKRLSLPQRARPGECR